MKPPRGARTLLRLALPRDVRDAAIGDLDEEFTTHVAPDRGRASAVAWYWRQAIASLPAALRLRWSTGSGRAHAHERDAAVMTDLRYGLRLLRRYPSFTLAVVSTHGLGVAVTCAVVSIVYAMLRPLPYADPERLVHLHETLEGREAGGGQSSYPDFLELRRSARSFEYVGGYSGGSRTVTARAVPAERVPMAEVTDGFFEALGVQPLMGRLFEPADGRRDGPPVVAITYASWRRRFNADPSIVGRLLTLNGQAHTIVAVLPAGFEFPLRGLAELWLPMRPSRAQEERQYYHWMDIIARVRRDVSAEQLRDDLAAIARRLTEVDPKYHPSPRLSATPLHDDVIGSLRSAMLVLTAAVALVMLVTCANVAGLMLARAAGREREMSVRAAVGASGVRLARQLLIESLLLGAPGSALGLLAGHWIARVFVASLPPFQRASLPRLQNLSIDPSVALISLTAALATALLFGLAPAWRAAHGRACVSFSGAGRSSASVREGRLRGALVAAQVALAFILLASAGLVGKSVYRLLRVSPGFDATNLLTLRVNLGAHYTKAEQILAFHDEFLHRLRAQPGVSGAESIDQLPLTGRGNTGTFSIDGRPDPQKDATHVTAIRGVSRGYFRVMGIPLLGGRGFASSDTASTTRVALVNRTFADRFFQGAALGHRISFVFFTGQPQWEIAGIVADEQFVELDREPIPVVYFPVAQDSPSEFSVVVRATMEAAALTRSIRAVAATMDPDTPLYGVRTMEQIVVESAAVFMRRTVLALLAVFAGATMILAAMGVYGVLAQAVAARTKEIGVRAALGAGRADLARLMLARGLAPAVVGVLVGLPVTLAATRVLRTLLFNVAPTDAPTLAAVVIAVVAVAVIACFLPTWRAVRIDPATAIRQE